MAIFVIAFVLFFNALSDLLLPKIMSNIVNIGIQQQGIEHAAPDYMSQQGMELCRTFMTPDWRLKIGSYYVLGMDGDIDRSREQFYKEGRPLGGEELRIYIKRNDLTKAQIEELDGAFGDIAWNFIFAMQSFSKTTSYDIGEIKFDEFAISDFYILQPQLNMIPQSVIEDAYRKTAALDDVVKRQTGSVFAGLFLSELGISKADMQRRFIWRNGMLMLLFAFISGLCAVTVGFIIARVAAKVARRTRQRVFDKVLSFSNSELDNLPTSTLITRATNDVKQVQDFLSMGLRMLLYAPMMIAGGAILAYATAPSMTWIIALACAIIILIVCIAVIWIVPKFKLMQKFMDRINLIVREHLSGIMVIRAFSNKFFEKQRFDDANSDMADNMKSIGIGISTLMPVLMFVMNGISLVVIWVGAKQIEQSAIQVGDMLAFLQYSMQIIMSFMFLSMMFFQLPRAMVSANRIEEVLRTNPSVKNARTTRDMNPYQKGIVEFQNVSFRFGGAEVNALSDISFTAEPGKTTAIIGATGSGKSTLVNLILRYYDATEGKVMVGHEDVRRLDIKKLRANIGFAPQKGFLFTGDIVSNMQLADKNADSIRIFEALKISQSSKFIEKRLAKGEEAVSQGGANFSGGQRQRLSIARALVKDAPIYIFDDSFSALDMKTDRDLRKALRAEMKGKTLIIVAQRISTIKDADQIIVLDEGRMIGKGTHKQLISRCKEYREIAQTQGEI